MAICALLSLAGTHTVAQTLKKPAANDPQSAQQPMPARESSSSTRIKGRVVMDGGHPVAEATVMIFPVNVAGNVQGAITSLLRPATSDADGKFEFTSIRPGAYSLSASAPGYVSADPDPKVFYRPGDNATITLVKGGVITGKVTNTSGEPVVSVVVRAIKLREANDKPLRGRSDLGSQINDSLEMALGPFKTDDRGIYRIYGLTSGYYHVAAGGRSPQGVSFSGGTAYDRDAPTYYPSSTMETAAEVTVLAGEEAANIDIRYREHSGHSIGGSVTVSTGPAPQAITVLLTRPNSAVAEATAIVMAGRQNYGFDSLHDGEYVVTAMGTSGNMGMAAGSEGITASVSQPRRVTVRGADVSGINLIIEPLASISGRVVIEKLQDPKQKALCKELRPVAIEGTVLSTRDDRKDTLDAITGPLGAFKDTTPNEKSEFIISLLQPGTHWLAVQFPAEHLYLKTISLPQAEPNTKPIDAGKNGIRLTSGDKVKGLLVTMSEGAARLSGKVVVGADNKTPDANMRVHLVPAEPEAADDVLRYFESEVSNEGAFSLGNLQPGKYWLVARETTDAEQADASRKPLAIDAGARTGLRFEGEASKSAIELTTCQVVSDHRLKYAPLTRPKKPPAKKAAQ
jgi:protocatechuate 3,4-dioxygenase beta subunit